MENNIMNKAEKNFEDIKHIDENGVEFWYARELMEMLEYSKWGNFIKVIDKAKKSCENSNNTIFEHFADVGKTIKMPKNAEKIIEDMKLTRYACYLIAQNGDSRKKAIALAQTYFAVQTRKQGISEKEDVLDYMSSTELAANLFRITQTDEVLKNKNINNEDDVCITHHKVGQAVRQTIKRIGGTMPEDLPTPSKSTKQIEKEKSKRLNFKDIKKLKKNY